MSIATHVQISIEDLTALVNIAEAFAPDEQNMTGHIYWDAAERARKVMTDAGANPRAVFDALIEKAQ